MPSMCVTTTPISSIWPSRASVGAPSVAARTRAKEVPSVSLVTSAKAEAACRHTADAGSSCPVGPAAQEEVAEELRNRHGLRIQAGVLIVGAP